MLCVYVFVDSQMGECQLCLSTLKKFQNVLCQQRVVLEAAETAFQRATPQDIGTEQMKDILTYLYETVKSQTIQTNEAEGTCRCE